MLPNFLIIGAARAGTTTLYSYLGEHPDIYLPLSKRPEPHFFYKKSEYARGLAYYESCHFGGWHGEAAVGEASTSYIFGADTPRRVQECLPDVRLIAMLRNPVDRAFSNYWHSVMAGLETLPFVPAISAEAERIDALKGTALEELEPFSYVARSFYYEQLRRWYSLFDASHIHVILFEDFISDPRESLEKTLRFLGVSPDFVPERLDRIENKSVPDGKSVPTDVRRRLFELFKPDIRELEKLLKRDLSLWLPMEVSESVLHGSSVTDG